MSCWCNCWNEQKNHDSAQKQGDFIRLQTLADNGHTLRSAFAELKEPKKWAEILTWIIIFYLITVAGLLGIDATTDKLSRELQSKIMAPFYSNEKSHVVVILFDNKFLEENSWPPKYVTYVNLLDRLEKFNPKSVFFDMYFAKRYNENSDGARLLEKNIKELQSKFPIYSVKKDSSITDLSWNNPSTPVNAEWINVDSNFYPSRVKNKPSPAFQIYCDTNPSRPCPTNEMFITWGLSDTDNKNMFNKLLMGLSLLISNNDNKVQRKSYITRETYNTFMDIDEHDPRFTEYTGKHFIISTRLTGINDWITNPVDGKVEGALLHAMALDNLEKLHENYLINGDKTPVILGLTKSNIIELFSIALIYIIYRIFRTLGETRNACVRYLFLSAIMTFLTIASIAAISTFGFRHDPGNFLALMSLNYPLLELVTVLICLFITIANRGWKKLLDRLSPLPKE